MNKSAKKFIKYYLIFGVFWGLVARFPFGVMLSEYAGNQRYENMTTAVTSSYLTAQGELILCMQGRLATSKRYKSEITEFSLNIPIGDLLYDQKYKSELVKISEPMGVAIIISDKLIDEDSKACNAKNGYTHIKVKKSDYSPEEANDFYSERDLKGVKPDDGKDYMVFVLPTVNTFQGAHYMERVSVFILMKNPDVAGRYFYVFGLEDTWIDRDIGLHEYAIAFVKDALFYPVAIFMMGAGH